MAERTIVALYERLDDAHAAMRDLVDMGVLQDEITVGIRDAEGYRLDRGGQGAASTDRAIGGGDFLSALGGLNVPDEDAHIYAEAIRRGNTLLTARVAEGQLQHAMDILEHHGPVDIDERETEWRSAGWTRFDESAADRYATAGVAPTPDITGTAPTTGTSRATATSEGEETIPIVEEELQVGKRRVGGGRVRIHSYVVETPVREEVTLRDESVHIERRPADRPAGDIPAEAFKEKTIELTETHEEAVVSKTARVTEEVVVGKDVETRTETVSDTVRRTEVEVEDERTRNRPATGRTEK